MSAPNFPTISVVPRGEWSALPPRGEVEPVTHPLEKVFITMDTASKPCYDKETCLQVVADLQKRHMTCDNYPDIRYNFLVGGDGNIYEGRGWHQKPQLAKEEKYFEDKSLDIAYIGTYEVEDCPMSYYELFADFMLHGVTLKLLFLDKLFILDYLDLEMNKRTLTEHLKNVQKQREAHANRPKQTPLTMVKEKNRLWKEQRRKRKRR